MLRHKGGSDPSATGSDGQKLRDVTRVSKLGCKGSHPRRGLLENSLDDTVSVRDILRGEAVSILPNINSIQRAALVRRSLRGNLI